MTERLTDAQLDREVHAFLDRASRDVTGAPSAEDMALRIASRVGSAGGSHRSWFAPRTALGWLLLLAVLASVAATATFVIGSRPPIPLPVGNGWIAMSTQPGYRQTFTTDWAAGSDIYLLGAGSTPRIIVERGPDMKRNVCPTFSPDGSMLAYGELSGNAASLVVLHVSATGTVAESRRLPLAGPSSTAPCPRWSRNGTHLAYLDGVQWDIEGGLANPGTGVAVVTLDGAAVAPTTDDPSIDDLQRTGTFDPFGSPDGPDPLLSPDGQRRATCLEDVGFVIGPSDGTGGDRLLMTDACAYSAAAWSPDGTQILLLSDGGRQINIGSLPVAGGIRAGGDHIGSVPVNGARAWPGRGDVSWQSVHP